MSSDKYHTQFYNDLFLFQEQGSDVSSIAMLPLLSVVFFIVVFSLGYGPIPWMMVGELFSPEVSGILKI